MKPCLRHRKSVALLASSSLDPAEAAPIRQHLQACAGCREYFTEIFAVSTVHAAAAGQLAVADVAWQPRNPRTPATRASTESVWDRLLAGPGRRATFATGAAVAALLLGCGWLLWRGTEPPTPIQAATSSPMANPVAASTTEPDPRLINYRLALNRSPEELDRLLTEYAAATSGSGPGDSLRPTLALLAREP